MLYTTSNMSIDPASIIIGIVDRVGSMATTRMMLGWSDTLRKWDTNASAKRTNTEKRVKTR